MKNSAIYVESLGQLTLKPSTQVLIAEAHEDLIGEMHNYKFGKLLRSVEAMRNALTKLGFTTIVCNAKGWTELK